MKIVKKIKITKPIEDVWNVVGRNFHKSDEWMSAVLKSYKKTDKSKGSDDAINGRVCELSDSPNGMKADEVITVYDEDKKILGFEVVPMNVPAIFPVKKNIVHISLNKVNENETEVVWVSTPQLKISGYIFYILLFFGFSKGFSNILQELKHYVENGIPHPRKLKKLNK